MAVIVPVVVFSQGLIRVAPGLKSADNVSLM